MEGNWSVMLLLNAHTTEEVLWDTDWPFGCKKWLWEWDLPFGFALLVGFAFPNLRLFWGKQVRPWACDGSVCFCWNPRCW